MLDELNARLKQSGLGISVVVRGNRFYLSAQLPPKPNATKNYPHQQRIATGLVASVSNLGEVERRVIALAGQLIDKTFSWSQESSKKTIVTFEDAIESFKASYLIKGKLSTWEGDYMVFFKRLPQDEPINGEIITNLIETLTSDNSSPRKRICVAMNGLAKSAGLDLDLSSLRGSYSARAVNPRDLPDDKTIQDWFFRIEYRPWQWVYGMLAAFGLRNHEVFFIDLDYLKRNGVCWVLEGKRGPGKVWPFYPEWLDLFQLRDISVPEVTGKYHRDYGMRVSKAFARYKIPFPPYSLRHSWARRTIDMGLDSRMAAKQMRHSHTIHTATYNLWLDDASHQRVYGMILDNPNRPKPPGV